MDLQHPFYVRAELRACCVVCIGLKLGKIRLSKLEQNTRVQCVDIDDYVFLRCGHLGKDSSQRATSRNSRFRLGNSRDQHKVELENFGVRPAPHHSMNATSAAVSLAACARVGFKCGAAAWSALVVAFSAGYDFACYSSVQVSISDPDSCRVISGLWLL